MYRVALSVTFKVNGELYLLTASGQMARWKIESEAVFRFSSSSRRYSSYHPPFIVGNTVYIANKSGPKVETFSLETVSLSPTTSYIFLYIHQYGCIRLLPYLPRSLVA